MWWGGVWCGLLVCWGGLVVASCGVWFSCCAGVLCSAGTARDVRCLARCSVSPCHNIVLVKRY